MHATSQYVAAHHTDEVGQDQSTFHNQGNQERPVEVGYYCCACGNSNTCQHAILSLIVRRLQYFFWLLLNEGYFCVEYLPALHDYTYGQQLPLLHPLLHLHLLVFEHTRALLIS